MATIRKRGKGYQIRVFCGTDINGKKLMKTKTYTPDSGLTQKQIEKELNRQATLFEEDCRNGLVFNNNITFADFTTLWLKEYVEKNLKACTVAGYKAVLDNILIAIGHIKLTELKPIHLIQFYDNLKEKNIRKDIKYIPCDNIGDYFKPWSLKELSELTGVSSTTLSSVRAGKKVLHSTAVKLMSFFDNKTLFIQDEGKTTLAGKSILKYHNVISSILTAAVHWQFIASNPCQRVKAPKADTKEAQYLDDTDTITLISKLNNEPLKYRTAVMMLINTGCRRGELLGLEWSDIDFDNSTARINKELLYLPDKGLFEDTPKNRTSNRVIKISGSIIQLLQEWQTEQLRQRLLVGDRWDDSNKVFTNDFGKPIRPDTFSAWFKDFVRRYNLPDIHIHTLRHTSASLLIADGTDIRTVSKRLGHASTSTTLNIYTHAIKSADEAAAESLDRLFKQA